jgi:hypothetical protein
MFILVLPIIVSSLYSSRNARPPLLHNHASLKTCKLLTATPSFPSLLAPIRPSLDANYWLRSGPHREPMAAGTSSHASSQPVRLIGARSMAAQNNAAQNLEAGNRFAGRPCIGNNGTRRARKRPARPTPPYTSVQGSRRDRFLRTFAPTESKTATEQGSSGTSLQYSQLRRGRGAWSRRAMRLR